MLERDQQVHRLRRVHRGKVLRFIMDAQPVPHGSSQTEIRNDCQRQKNAIHGKAKGWTRRDFSDLRDFPETRTGMRTSPADSSPILRNASENRESISCRPGSTSVVYFVSASDPHPMCSVTLSERLAAAIRA